MATYVVGDIHGAYDSLIELVELMKVNIDKDTIISLGDIVDKGNKIKEVVDFFRYYGFPVICGNHESKFHRLAKGNKIKLNPEVLDTKRQLGDEWEEYGLWMGTLPLYLPFEDDQGFGYFVHGGVDPYHEIDKQPPNFLMRLRTWPFEVYVKGQPTESPPWQTVYTGHLGTIIHGHIPSASYQHSGMTFHGNPNVYSLDGGCVYHTDREWGGELRGMRLGSREIFAVKGNQRQLDHYNSLV
jgi:serine/threonine protein phosphatase 1